ncbi:MAG: CopG family transcriptional regulator [Ruminococcus sp.]|nr:CopG family transcriptional regulator [Ruminococcus sp.]MCI9211792.1 CopG family transcriptional regulator [Ruminococcus sp.]
MGRPKAEKPKEIKYSIRTDEETERRLRAYCEAMGISRGEAYREGIKLLLEQSEEKK